MKPAAQKVMEEIYSPDELYTADQLRQAKVEVLREAAEKLMNCGEEFAAKHLRIMADELEKQG